jgi:signal transduction histidine kinase
LIGEVSTAKEIEVTMGVRAELDARQLARGERGRPTAALASALIAAIAALGLLPVLARAPTLSAPTLGATLETAMTCAALAAAWLLHARFADSRRVRDLLASAAVGTLGLMNLSDRVLPTLLAVRGGHSLVAVQLCGQLIVAGLFAAAAFTSGNRLLTRPRRPVAAASGASVAAALTATLAGILLGPHLLGRGGESLPNLTDHPVASGLSILAIALLGSSALRLASRGDHGVPDAPTGILATASVLLAAAGLYELVGGLTAVGTVAPMELPRVCAFALVLVAAMRHEPQARARVAQAAALAERRRVARDLHDGLAQDLAFIAAHGPALSEELGDDHPLVIAAGRALAISRSTITGLCDPAEATAAQALEAVAQELREQFDVTIAVNVGGGIDVEPRAREHVARISREAIANAVRHGGARNVSVSLNRLERATVLRVVDDGCGLEDATSGCVTPEGFGLGSMRERAAALGGYLSVHQPRHGGTELEVVFR